MMFRSVSSSVRFAALVVAAALAASAPASAQSTHVRGEVAAISGDIVTVATTAGGRVEVAMKPDYGFIVYEPITIDDVKVGDYLSIPALPGTDGIKRALAINVFPEPLRGLNEGESAWDIAPESRMVNATVGTMAAMGADHSVTVTYGGTSEQVIVPDGTPVTRFGPVAGRRLAVGDNTVLFAQEADGKLTAALAGVSADGTLPPI